MNYQIRDCTVFTQNRTGSWGLLWLYISTSIFHLPLSYISKLYHALTLSHTNSRVICIWNITMVIYIYLLKHAQFNKWVEGIKYFLLLQQELYISEWWRFMNGKKSLFMVHTSQIYTHLNMFVHCTVFPMFLDTPVSL